MANRAPGSILPPGSKCTEQQVLRRFAANIRTAALSSAGGGARSAYIAALSRARVLDLRDRISVLQSQIARLEGGRR